MKKCILTVLLALLAVFNLMGAEKSPFQWSAVVQEVKSGRWKVRVLCQIAEKSYLYTGATKVSVTLADGNTADIKLPPGVPQTSATIRELLREPIPTGKAVGRDQRGNPAR